MFIQNLIRDKQCRYRNKIYFWTRKLSHSSEEDRYLSNYMVQRTIKISAGSDSFFCKLMAGWASKDE